MVGMSVDLRIRAVDQASKTIGQVGRAIRGLEQSGAKGMAAAAGRQSHSTGMLGGARGGGAAAKGGSMGMPLGFSPGMLGGLGAGLGFKELVSDAADFESQLTAIQKKAGTTADETKRIGQEALALATSGEIASSIDEIMSAYERGAAAGIPLDELREFSRLSAMAADAFEMSSEDVGNAAAGFKVGLGIGMDGMEEYFGLINALADSGIAEERDLINFLDRAGASLKLFGLSAEQAAAYGSTIANIKMAPDVGARMMSSLTTSLLAPGSKKARASLKGIVGDIDDFQKMLKKDANGGLEFFLQKINELDKFESADLLTGFIGKGFSDEVIRLAGAYDELQRNQKLAADRNAWKGSLGASYDLKLDDFWSQWQLLKNEFSKFTIDIGTAGMPTVMAALEGARGLIHEIQAGMERFSLTLDYAEINNAKAALGELGAAVEAFMGIKTDGSPISTLGGEAAKEINRLAKVINTISDTVDAYKRANDDDPRNDPPTGTNVVSGLWEAGRIALGRDEIATYNQEKERNVAQQAARPGTAPRIAPPEASRFGVPADLPAAPPPAPPVIPDMTAFFSAMGQMEQARIPMEQPIVTSADLNTSAWMAGLSQMEGATAGFVQRTQAMLNSISAPTPGGGGGGNYERARDGQFAPVNPK